MDTELTRIAEGAGIAGREKSKHGAISAVGHVIGAVAGRDDELRACAQTEQASWFSKQANVEADAKIGHRIGIGPRGSLTER